MFCLTVACSSLTSGFVLSLSRSVCVCFWEQSLIVGLWSAGPWSSHRLITECRARNANLPLLRKTQRRASGGTQLKFRLTRRYRLQWRERERERDAMRCKHDKHVLMRFAVCTCLCVYMCVCKMIRRSAAPACSINVLPKIKAPEDKKIEFFAWCCVHTARTALHTG